MFYKKKNVFYAHVGRELRTLLGGGTRVCISPTLNIYVGSFGPVADS